MTASKTETVETTETTEDALAPRKMSSTLKRYRGAYDATLSSRGKVSADSGKPVSVALRGLEPETVCMIAEELLGFHKGSLMERYKALNRGQVRMNAGNRIANSVKKGLITVEQVIEAANSTKA